jgi:hypothetical protein
LPEWTAFEVTFTLDEGIDSKELGIRIADFVEKKNEEDLGIYYEDPKSKTEYYLVDGLVESITLRPSDVSKDKLCFTD